MDRRRVEEDIRQFEDSFRETEGKAADDEWVRENLKRAGNYYEDAKYFLEKGDVFTAWGTINYAHGILDAVRRKLGMGCYGALE